jgi:hypothetical protein
MDYNRDFINRILARIGYDALRAAVNDVSWEFNLEFFWIICFFLTRELSKM